jgi:hypothetical protein
MSHGKTMRSLSSFDNISFINLGRTKLSQKAPYKSLPHIYVMRGKGVE